MKRFFVVTAVLLVFLVPVSVSAGEGWVIRDFDSLITIRQDGIVQIEETISADFLNFQKHGIYRTIPYIYQNSDGSREYTEISVQSVTWNGASEPYSTSTSNGNLVIQIGNANVLITGAQTYRIAYTAKGILRSFDAYDELYWNVMGNGWPVPIDRSTATIILPQNGIVQISCYAGQSGSTASCASKEQSGTMARFAQGSLRENEGLTVAVGYLKGMVPILSVAQPLTAEHIILTPAGLIGFVVALVFGLILIIRVWWKRGRDIWWQRKSLYDPDQKETIMPLGGYETIVAEYDPPDKLPPGILGLIKDETADTVDISATIVDCAVRGYLTINKITAKSFIFSTTDYELKKTKEPDNTLFSYERLVLDSLFKSATTIKLSSIKYKFNTKLGAIKKVLYAEGTSRGYFTGNPQSVRLRYGIASLLFPALGLVFLFLAFGMQFSLVFRSAIAGAGLGFMLLFPIAFLFALKAMPQRTAQGRELYRSVRGYRLFLENVEKYRQQFFEKENMFNTVLPYAIMFGLTAQLANALKVMGYVPPQPVWFVGVGPFDIISFSNSIDSFASTLATSIASAPRGSGSGGGGFSGGGFGGGGGGSW